MLGVRDKRRGAGAVVVLPHPSKRWQYNCHPNFNAKRQAVGSCEAASGFKIRDHWSRLYVEVRIALASVFQVRASDKERGRLARSGGMRARRPRSSVTLHTGGIAIRIALEMSQPTTRSDPYALWKNASYRQYSGSWFLITFSRRIEFVAVGFYLAELYDLKEASFALGLLGLVQALPVMLLAIPGGQLADRFNRLRVMTLSFSLGVVSAGGMLVVALLGGDIWWLFLLLAVGAIGWALGNPSRQALLPSLIPAELFSTGVAWSSSVFYVAFATGPVVGGVLVWAFHGMAPAFALVLLCRIVAMLGIVRIRYRPAEHSEQSLSWASVMAGIRFVWETPLILATITLDLFAVLLGGATYLIPVYATKILHVGSLGFGALQSADAVGAICMAMLLAHRRPMRRPGVTLLWAVVGFGVATIVFGLSEWFWLSLLMMFSIGALDNISVVVRHTLVQMLTPDEMRGRVSAVNGIFIVASNDLGGMESGFTARLFGPVASVVAGGVGTILVVLAAMRIWPQLLKIEPLDSIRPAAMEEPDRDV
jgi:MFS family permease